MLFKFRKIIVIEDLLNILSMAKGLRMLTMLLLLFLPLLSALPLDTTGGHMRTNNEKHTHEDVEFMERLRQLFKSIDTNEDGKMNAKEFLEFSLENNLSITETEAEKVFALADSTLGFTEDKFVEVLKDSPGTFTGDLVYFLLPGAPRLSRVSDFEERMNSVKAVFLALDVDHNCRLNDVDLKGFFKDMKKEISAEEAKNLLGIGTEESGGVDFAMWKNVALSYMLSTSPLVSYWKDAKTEVEKRINSADGAMRAGDTIINNTAKVVVNTLQFDARMDECYKVENFKVVNASVKVEDGLEFTLKLRLVTKSGRNCKDETTKVCANFVVFKPLPEKCHGISSLKIIKRDQVKCDNICAANKVVTYNCLCENKENGFSECSSNQICSSAGTCLDVCDPSPEGDCFCLGANHQGEPCSKGKICRNGKCLDITGLHFPDNKCFPENSEMVFYIAANRFSQIDMPKWEIALKGTGVSQEKSSRPSLGITTLGDPSKPTSFKGEVHSHDGKDGDVIGMVFGFQDPANFFVVASSRDKPGPMNWYVGRVHGTCGTSCQTTNTISDAIWNPASHRDEITVLKNGTEHWLSWKHYEFSICFNPSLLELNVTVVKENDGNVLATGVISAATGKAAVDEKSREGGLIGMYVDSQKDVHWEGLECGTCVFPAVHGEYSQWSEYGSCSKTCGGGVKTRTRTCTQPKYGGKTCEEQDLGTDTETMVCNSGYCPDDPLAACHGVGTGWRLVRHLPIGDNWHPATDQLIGTDEYGDPNNMDEAWSIKFDQIPFNQFLFSTGDCSKWLIAGKEDVLGGFYSNEARQIQLSSTSTTPYTAKWYRREGDTVDPWISLTDHHGASSRNDILYGGNQYAGANSNGLRKHNGANVFIREASTAVSTGAAPASGPPVFFIAGGRPEALRDILLYDPSESNLVCSTPPPALNKDWDAHQTFYHDNTVYLCGGRFDTENLCISYSPGMDGWKEHPLTTSITSDFYAVVVQDRVYFIGEKYAMSTSLPLTDTPEFTPITNVDYKGSRPCVAKIDEDTFVITGGRGNFREHRGYMATAATYNVKTKAYTPLPDIKQRRNNHGCGVLEEGNQKFLIIYGGWNGGPATKTEMLELGGSEWVPTENMNENRQGGYSVVTEKGFMVAGGQRLPPLSGHTSSVELLDLATKTWSTVKSLNKERSFYGGAVKIPGSMFGCKV